MTHTLYKHHADLVDRMATARGIDLQEAALRAQMVPDDLADIVQRCAGCTRADRCSDWLDVQCGSVSATPTFCRNADVFDALAAKSG